MEEGFRSAEESKKLGLCPYTALVHTLVAGDLPRLNHYAKNKINAEKLNKGKQLDIQISSSIETITQ